MAVAVTVTWAAPSDIGMTVIAPPLTDTPATGSLSDRAPYQTVTFVVGVEQVMPPSP